MSRIGDRLSCDVIDRLPLVSKVTRPDLKVTAVTEEHVISDEGLVVRDHMGSQVRTRNGAAFCPRQDHPAEYAEGRSRATRYDVYRQGSRAATVTMNFLVAARGPVTVPAGTFDCFRVEGHGISRRLDGPPVDIPVTRCNAPGRVRGIVAIEEVRRASPGGHVKTPFSERMELVSFEQS